MQIPLDKKTEKEVRGAIQRIANGPEFTTFMAWIKLELSKRDVENRCPEFANKTTEAQALAVIVEYVAACMSPNADRDKLDSMGEETPSAAPIV
jgi:hypothetical protein